MSLFSPYAVGLLGPFNNAAEARQARLEYLEPQNSRSRLRPQDKQLTSQKEDGKAVSELRGLSAVIRLRSSLVLAVRLAMLGTWMSLWLRPNWRGKEKQCLRYNLELIDSVGVVGLPTIELFCFLEGDISIEFGCIPRTFFLFTFDVRKHTAQELLL